MAHVWQETMGEPSRRGYHNRQWAEKMREVGLQPTSTGEPGGMETGQAVTHYIIPEGHMPGHMLRSHLQGISSTGNLSQRSVVRRNQARKVYLSGVRTKRLGEAGRPLICGECYDEGEGDIAFMLAEQE